MGSSVRVSVIMPVWNEAAVLESALRALQQLRRPGWELIVVDGGSSDDSAAIAGQLADQVLQSGAGRALQMNTGAAAAQGELLCFLHADTSISTAAAAQLDACAGQRCWGRFDVFLDAPGVAFWVISWFIRGRSRLTAVVTGDQVLFVSRDLFRQVGGFPQIPLMEDVALSKRLREWQLPRCLSGRVRTSARRWQQHGIARTVLLMWKLRWDYYRGVSPALLAARYRSG